MGRADCVREDLPSRASSIRSTLALRSIETPGVPDLLLQSVTKTFEQKQGTQVDALRDLTLEVGAGEILTLVGPSGSGKTTLLRIVAGLESPTQGTVLIDGRDVTRVPAGQRAVAMVFQTLALYPHMTAAQNMGFGLKLRGQPRSLISEQVMELAQRLKVAGCLARYPSDLSGGERQRVALGRALIGRPDILLLDEPFSNLDAPLKRDLRREVLHLHEEMGLTTLLVTHDQTEAAVMGQRMAVTNAGRLEQVGTPGELRHQPATPFVREFLTPDLL